MSKAGYIDQRLNGTVTDRDRNKENTTGFRFSALYKPTDFLEITPAAFYEKTNVKGSSIFFNTLPGLSTGYRLPEFGADRMTQYTLTAVASFEPFTVTSASSAYQRKFNRQEDYTLFLEELFGIPDPDFFGEPFLALDAPNATDSNLKLYTQELRFASGETDSRVRWQVGGFFSKQDLKTAQDVFFTGLSDLVLEEFGIPVSDLFGFPIPANDAVYFGNGRSEEEQRAVFGEFSYNLTEKLRLTAGMRYFDIDRTITNRGDGFFNGGPSSNRLSSSETGNDAEISSVVSGDLQRDGVCDRSEGLPHGRTERSRADRPMRRRPRRTGIDGFAARVHSRTAFGATSWDQKRHGRTAGSLPTALCTTWIGATSSSRCFWTAVSASQAMSAKR